ncbi:MAG: hypothetical protein J6O41_01140 [Clostridia bacterium]|nr:hypothetical protein [Clostridia bacterium]
MKKKYILVIVILLILLIVMSVLIMVNSNHNYLLDNNVEGIFTEEMTEKNALIQGEIITDELKENLAYEKTESITIPRNIVVKDGETIAITLTPLIFDTDRIDEYLKFFNEDLDITNAYKNEDNSITLILSGEQLESLIKKYEYAISQRIDMLYNSDISIDIDLDKISYYIYNNCNYLSFETNRVFIEPLILAAQSLSGINYTDCNLGVNVIDAETGDLLFEYYTDSNGLHNVPTKEEWNEKLGIANIETGE